MDVFLNEIRLKVDKEKKNEVNVKDQSTFLKPNNFKSLKKSLAYKEIIRDNLLKSHYETNGICLCLD